AHSSVRNALGLEFSGFTYAAQSLVVATPFPFEKYVDQMTPVTYWSGPHGRVSTIRTPDLWRVAITTDVPAGELPDAHNTNPHHAFTNMVRTMFAGQVEPRAIELRQHQFYRSHQKVAETFRVGRVLLAGDAAHLASTTGGTGFNSG